MDNRNITGTKNEQYYGKQKYHKYQNWAMIWKTEIPQVPKMSNAMENKYHNYQIMLTEKLCATCCSVWMQILYNE